MRDLISVIVPVYNAEQYIERCIKSLLKQSYKNFELILVNDGSKDNSLQICRKYELIDSRIRVIDRQNGGASAARNTGLENMNGNYVVFSDSDDYVSGNYLENLYLAAKAGDYDIVQCNLKCTSDLQGTIDDVTFHPKDVREVKKVQALNDRVYKVSVCGKIYSAQLFNDFKFKEGIIYEDDASYYIFVDRAKRLAVLDETLYFYYMSDNSVMRNSQKAKSTAFINIYEDRIKYFKERNEEELLEGTYDRFCLVMMLTISDSLRHGYNRTDIELFIDLFKKYYLLTMKSNAVGIKDKVMFTCFRISPRIIGHLIGKIRG